MGAYGAPVEGVSGEVVFSRDVLPVLSDYCFQCHGPDAKEGRKGDLRLDLEEDVKRERDGYFVIDPGNVEGSELIRRIFSNDPDEVMPPPELGRSPTSDEKLKLRQWVNDGAAWGKHWAFETVVRPEVPEGFENQVDAFVSKAMDGAGLEPNGLASKRTLARRLSLDLRGLPPTPAEVEDFVSDDSPGAWEKLVDRFLADEAFGQRMAWDWLDAARYADTNGYQGDNERTMWPWRDWVVRAYNDNLPFDDFTVWQLAGDLLPGATHDQILATGFNRNHMINGEGGRIAEENRVDYVMDMTETMGTVWLGLTFNCCRCHDHKFDPLKQEEYYEMTAFFNQTPVNGGGGNGQTPPVLASPSPSQNIEIEKLRLQLDEAQQQFETIRSEYKAKQADWEKATLDALTGESVWRPVRPVKAEARSQTLTIEDNMAVLASGANPATDEYVIEVQPGVGRISGFLLEALRHPSMTNNGLARSDSGNFVLTDIRFSRIKDPGSDDNPEALPVSSAEATFEQGNHTIDKAFDGDPQSGWAVWNGKPFDRDHAAVFRLTNPVELAAESVIRVQLSFESPHMSHNLGYFRISTSAAGKAGLPGSSDQLLADIRVAPGERTPAQYQRIEEAYFNSITELKDLASLRDKRRQAVDQFLGRVPKVMVMEDRRDKRPTYILDRGLYNQPGREVTADVPEALPAMAVRDPSRGADRLDLARWLVGRDQPLTSRVVVNRLWQMLFGVGLVKTSEDFGVQGEYPAQRELLDWLAAEFMESGWDTKHLLRLIVSSETYRRDSRITSAENYQTDPANHFLSRGARYRLPSWMIRDQALAASGILYSIPGGPSVNPYQPDGVWSEATFGKKKYQPGQGVELYRRSLYTFWRRIVGPTLFFDAARRQVCEVKPLRTNTPMHALTVMNDITYVEAAGNLAVRAMSAGDTFEDRLDFIYRRVLSRPPESSEQLIVRELLDKARQTFSENPGEAQSLLGNGVAPFAGRHDTIGLASWTIVCLNLLNLDETLNRE